MCATLYSCIEPGLQRQLKKYADCNVYSCIIFVMLLFPYWDKMIKLNKIITESVSVLENPMHHVGWT